MRLRRSSPAMPAGAAPAHVLAGPSLLAGMLFDRNGNRMTPTHAVKKDRRYHYYASRPRITKERTESSTGLRSRPRRSNSS